MSGLGRSTAWECYFGHLGGNARHFFASAQDRQPKSYQSEARSEARFALPGAGKAVEREANAGRPQQRRISNHTTKIHTTCNIPYAIRASMRRHDTRNGIDEPKHEDNATDAHTTGIAQETPID